VVTPDYFHVMSDEIEKESLADWKTYLRWHAAHDAATSLSAAFVKENFSFYGKTLRGLEELPRVGSAAQMMWITTWEKRSARRMLRSTSVRRPSRRR
jgi:predicted metalloendopeptidase